MWAFLSVVTFLYKRIQQIMSEKLRTLNPFKPKQITEWRFTQTPRFPPEYKIPIINHQLTWRWFLRYGQVLKSTVQLVVQWFCFVQAQISSIIVQGFELIKYPRMQIKQFAQKCRSRTHKCGDDNCLLFFWCNFNHKFIFSSKHLTTYICTRVSLFSSNTQKVSRFDP